ncbi:hypothetical protein [Herbaspirillum sp. GW103]|uniref:hypothetical protein n=1 Tax=Herbaspirillum sp. GW103 TaxID=1175306 RepID=UPI00054D53C7|nr:hypothetical protein [Herbaspirillum sp. GW103]
MFFSFGTPELLSSIGSKVEIAAAKSRIQIAVIDDNPFAPRDALLAHNFRLAEIGHDIRTVDQIAAYPIVICDVGGVAKALGSPLEGAHLVSEIRKTFPDKFLIAYTGLTYSLSITNALTAADRRLEKDASVDIWVKALEDGIEEISNARNRWVRLRRSLLERGVEIYEIFRLEQAFIKAVQKNKPNYLEEAAKSAPISSEVKDLVVKFSATAVASLIGTALGV